MFEDSFREKFFSGVIVIGTSFAKKEKSVGVSRM
jgi:hypothetical protein